jgi:hypothetical protein
LQEETNSGLFASQSRERRDRSTVRSHDGIKRKAEICFPVAGTITTGGGEAKTEHVNLDDLANSDDRNLSNLQRLRLAAAYEEGQDGN